MKISEKIYHLRKKRKLSQEQLANKLDVSRQAVYKWEADISQPEIDKIRKLAQIFGVSCDFLLDDSLDLSSAYTTSDSATIQKEPDKTSNACVESDILTNEPEPTEPSKEKGATTKKKRLKPWIIVLICFFGTVIMASWLWTSVKIIKVIISSLNPDDTKISTDSGIDTGTDSLISPDPSKSRVTFKMPNGQVISVQDLDKGKAPTVPTAPLMSIYGYEFVCYQYNGKEYKSGEVLPNGSVVYAHYEPVKYIVRYEANGESLTNEEFVYTYTVESNTIYLPSLKKTGYNFLGWYEDSNFERKIEKIKKGSVGNKTLFAKFELANYVINYEVNGGKNSTKNPSEYNVETELVLAEPSCEGLTFEGWYTEPWFENKITKIEKGTVGSLDLYAKWSLNGFSFAPALDGYEIISVSVNGAGTYLPQTFNGKRVVGIGSYAFCGLDIESVYIPEGYKYISKNAFFECKSLVNVNISSSVNQIDPQSFVDCTAILSYSISGQGGSVFSTRNGVLFNSAMTHLVLFPCAKSGAYEMPDTVNYIDPYAFYKCTGLTSVTFAPRVGGIDASAFEGCTNLESVTLGEELNYIAHRAFTDCKSLKSITLPKKHSSVGNYAFDGCVSLESIEAPQGVDVFGYAVFRNCTRLSHVNLGKECKNISTHVFQNCVSLKSITIPKGTNEIGTEVFDGCTSLESVYLNTEGIYTLRTTKGTLKEVVISGELLENGSAIADCFLNEYAEYVWTFDYANIFLRDNVMYNVYINGDFFSNSNPEILFNGAWDESNQDVLVSKGTKPTEIFVNLDYPITISKIMVKGRGVSTFTVSVLYEGQSEMEQIGASDFLSSEENSAQNREIPTFVPNQTKKISRVIIYMESPTTSDYWEELAIYESK